MFFIIRSSWNGEVIGIIDERLVLPPEKVGKMINRYPHGGIMGTKLLIIINAILNDGLWKNKAWGWYEITQAEYETYRDLHGFHVIKYVPCRHLT